LKLTAHDRQGSARIAELPGHPFYLGTLFLPQLASTPGNPHPLIRAFLEAAAARH
jgi:CTP synthase (UTP-ammonia lyase)